MKCHPSTIASGGSRGGGGADLTEQYRNNQRQNCLSDSFVPFLNFKLKRPQRGGWLATQSTLPLDLPLIVNLKCMTPVLGYFERTQQFGGW